MHFAQVVRLESGRPGFCREIGKREAEWQSTPGSSSPAGCLAPWAIGDGPPADSPCESPAARAATGIPQRLFDRETDRRASGRKCPCGDTQVAGIDDQVATDFSSHFSKGLAGGASIQMAFHEAATAVSMPGGGKHAVCISAGLTSRKTRWLRTIGCGTCSSVEGVARMPTDGIWRKQSTNRC
jgi:hypothetical protein